MIKNIKLNKYFRRSIYILEFVKQCQNLSSDYSYARKSKAGNFTLLFLNNKQE
jgi:hypothetical protein